MHAACNKVATAISSKIILNEFFGEKRGCPLGLPCQQDIDNNREEKEGEVNKLYSMVDRYYLQHVCLVSSGQRRKCTCRFACLVALSQIFAKSLILQ
jgi:hypothetical protein